MTPPRASVHHGMIHAGLRYPGCLLPHSLVFGDALPLQLHVILHDLTFIQISALKRISPMSAPNALAKIYLSLVVRPYIFVVYSTIVNLSRIIIFKKKNSVPADCIAVEEDCEGDIRFSQESMENNAPLLYY